MHDLTIRRSWLARALAGIRALSIVEAPADHVAGTDFGTDVSAPQPTDPFDLMSALGSFAWVYTATNICSRDLAGLPRMVIRGEGADAEPVEDHPFLRLMRQPRMRVNGVKYARQRWADWYLSGNAYDLVLRQGSAVSLQRLHPARVEVVTERNGDPRAFQYDARGAFLNYAWDDVIWMGGISWRDDPSGSYGQGAIMALMSELNAEHAVIEASKASAKRGQPSFVVSPSDANVRWTQEQVEKITETINRALSRAQSGALVVGGASDVTPLGWSPRDMEYISLRTWVRDTVLAVYGIPQSKAGVPSANYATARQEDVSYWEARMADAELRDAADSRLAQLLSGNPDDRVRTDFSGVQALQYNRTERQDRARQWWVMGLSLDEALSAEGFDDVAAPEEQATSQQGALNGAQVQAAITIVQSVASGQIPRPAGIGLLMTSFQLTEDQAEAIMGNAGSGFVPVVEGAAPRAQDAGRSIRSLFRSYTRPVTEDERAAVWRAFETDLRGPWEQRIALTMERFLAQQQRRYVARLEKQAGGRSVRQPSVDLLTLLDEAGERALLAEALGPALQGALEAAFGATADQVGAEIAMTPGSIQALLDDLIDHVQGTTGRVVASIVGDGISEGESVTTMAARIRQAAAFSPTRALAIARTETTKVVNQGAIDASRQAIEDGVDVVGHEWLSARDSHVRDTHRALDGDVQPIDGLFTTEDGDTAAGPGQFATAANNVNCRCTLLPVLGD